jgi:hypothetical protein
MKSLSFLAAALAVSNVAAIGFDHPLLARAVAKHHQKRQMMTSLVNGMFNRTYIFD